MAPHKVLGSKVATFLAVFTATQSVVGCVTNAIVLLYFLLTRKSLKTTADKLILNLVLADFIALSTYVPWRSYLLILRAVTKHYKIYTSLFVTCIFSTGNAILLIGLDRFIAVVWPLRYKVIVTRKVLWIAITAAWISAILLGVVHGVSLEFGIHKQYELFLCGLSFSQLIILSIIYAILLRTARIQTRNIARSLQLSTGKRDYSIRKTIRTTFIIVCFFYAAFIPYAVYRLVSTADKSLSNEEKRKTWRWLTAFTFLNSCFDPLVYFFGMKTYRTNFRQRFSQSSKHGNEIINEAFSLRNVSKREASNVEE